MEPQFTYDTRIRNCLELHNLAVKALRYPSDKKNDNVETIEQQRERELMVCFRVSCITRISFRLGTGVCQRNGRG